MRKRSNIVAVLSLAALVSVALFAFYAMRGKSKISGSRPLLCLVGGTMRPVMEELAERYRRETGQEILIDYAGSGELLIKIEQTGQGDLYVAHDPFLAAVMNKDLADRGWTVAALDPLIVVRKGNPKKISGFRDLAKPGVKVVFTHPDYSTTGHIVSRMIDKTGLAETLTPNIVNRTRGGGGAANAVIVGTADAAVVWNAVAYLRRDKLDTVPLEEDVKMKRGVDAVTTATFGRIDMDYIRVTVATLRGSKQPERARQFAEYITSEKSQEVWQSFGFDPADRSRPHPMLIGSIFVHCAAGMRLPIRAMADEFKSRYGVSIDLNYDGSNRLLGQIKLTRKGDVYISGDTDYIEMAAKAGLVQSSRTVCYFVPVIMTAKGNPKGIRSLADLTRPGLRIGQGDEKAAAVGRLTPKILALNGIDQEAWSRNVVMETPTVNELGMGIKLGTIDAAIVWDAIAAKYSNFSDIVAIDPERNICPAVGVAVLKTAENPESGQAFLEFMTSEQGRRVLKQHGYTVAPPGKKRSSL